MTYTVSSGTLNPTQLNFMHMKPTYGCALARSIRNLLKRRTMHGLHTVAREIENESLYNMSQVSR